MGVVIVCFFVAAARYVLHLHAIPRASSPSRSTIRRPFPGGAVSTGTSIAVLTYIGFDGISTLSEEVRNPRRNILLATVLTCLITGVLATLEVYAAQLDLAGLPPLPGRGHGLRARGGACGRLRAVPGREPHAAGGHHRLRHGSAAGGGAPALRHGPRQRHPEALLRRHRAQAPASRATTSCSSAALALAGAFLISYQLGAELLNFGAFIAFMGVNAAAFIRYYVREPEKKLTNFIVPVLGFVICLYIWLSLRTPAKIAGGIWLLVGIAYGAYKTNGFRRRIEFSEPPPE